MPDEQQKTDPHPLSHYVTDAFMRNRDPILQAFEAAFPKAGDVLEIGAGSGGHLVYFAPRFPRLCFHPSDRDANLFGVMEANRAAAGVTNVAVPIVIDLAKPETWPGGDAVYDAVYAINVLHVASIAAVDGAAAISSRALKPGGLFAIYGPFKLDGEYTSSSNEAFDRSIRRMNGAWGLRDVRDLENAMNAHGMVLREKLDMPANNFLLLFKKAQAA